MRARNFCFTINNYTQDDLNVLGNLEPSTVKYLIYGLEVGESGTPHIQGLVCWKDAKDFNYMKKNFSATAHYETMRGTFKQAADYCKKDGVFFEKGTLPADRGQLVKDVWNDVREKAKMGDFEAIPSDIYIRNMTNIHKIARMHMELPEDADQTTGVWIYGRSGVGKSRYARYHYPEFHHKMLNKWWDGYREHENVLLEDVAPDHKFLAYFLKIWMDRYAFPAEMKGDVRTIRPKKVIVTSQYTIEQCFEPTDAEAIRRRCKVIELVFPWTEPIEKLD